ncbi:MAG: MlaA family lipoprotein [Rhodospirillales bacterium]|nr:MlaA family lipoprotein [Rhodospirillales bacterium]
MPARTSALPARKRKSTILAALAALVVVATAFPAAAAVPAHVSAQIQALVRESQDIAERDRNLARTLNDPALGVLSARRNHLRTESLINAIVIAAIIESPALAPDVVATAVAHLPDMRDSIARAASAAFPGFAAAITRAAGTAPQAAPAIPRAVSRAPAPSSGPAPESAPPGADAFADGGDDTAGRTDADPGIYDPLESVNRGILVFNDAVDAVLIKPAAKFYGFVTPEFAKRGVRNFIRNLNAPVVLANDLLQLEGGDAAVTVGRFVVNTVFGVAGFAEVAEEWELPYHPADFGQTLNTYGSGPGAYLMLPILGPSTLRDGIGTGVDIFFHPFTYLFDTPTNLAITGGKALVRRESLIEPLDDLRATAIDYYAALRSAYFQDRAVELNKGAPPASPEVDRMFEEFE